MVKLHTFYIKKGNGKGFKKTEIALTRTKFAPSMTDTSYFVPTAEAVKTIDKTQTMSHDPSNYDYPNGIITSDLEKLAKIRRPGADITEIMATQRELVEEANNAIVNDTKNKIDSEIAIKAMENAKITEIASRTASKMGENKS